MSFNILTVCTGNICRSPFTEYLLRDMLQVLEPDIRISSAGIAAAVGQTMTAEMTDIARQMGVDTSEHRARFLTESILEQQDLILVMTREQRRAVTELQPRKSARTLTLRQFERIISGLPAGDLVGIENQSSDFAQKCRDVVQLAANNRGQFIPATPEDDDVVDPYRRTLEVYHRSVSQMVPGVRVISDLINEIGSSRKSE